MPPSAAHDDPTASLQDEIAAIPVRTLLHTAFMLTHRMHVAYDDSNDRALRLLIEDEIARRCGE